MSTTGLSNRLKRLEGRLYRRDKETFTLEELCREFWQADKNRFTTLANEWPALRTFITPFENEDAERESAGLRVLSSARFR